jgi:hypothetical protein
MMCVKRGTAASVAVADSTSHSSRSTLKVVMSNRRTTQSDALESPPKSGSLLNTWLVVSVVAACLVGGLSIAAFEMLRTGPNGAADLGDVVESRPAVESAEKSPAKTQTVAETDIGSNLVDDDGQTLWASPTSGPPLDLAYVPPGSQIVVAVRPGKLTRHGEGAKVLGALGPLGQRAIEYLDDATLSRFGELDLVLVSCQSTSDGNWQVALVAHNAHNKSPLSADALLTKLSGATPHGVGERKYWVADERAYYLPADQEGRVLVVAPPILMGDIVQLAGATPPLRRDVERLLALTDADRQLTIVVAPNFLFSEGQGMFSGEMARLRGPLFWFLGDGLSGAALSMNWDDNFFVELVAMPTLDVSPEKESAQLVERVRQIPELIEDYVVRLDRQPYGRRVVARFPAMVRKLASYTRSGVDDGAAVLRCYLPVVAGHNLIMGAELTLAESLRESGPAVSNRVAETASPGAPSVRDLLMRKTSLSFTRDSLEAALEQLSQDIGVEIVIVGSDLQADGITRNQQFGIHLENEPAADILVEILRKANPDKTATSAGDPRQKLVYVVKPKSPGEKEAVFVTTRARASERGDELPAAFRPNTGAL